VVRKENRFNTREMKNYGRDIYFIALNKDGDKIVCSQDKYSKRPVGVRYNTKDSAEEDVKNVSTKGLVEAPDDYNSSIDKKDIHLHIMSKYKNPDVYVEEILRYVCDKVGESVEEVVARGRRRELVDARKVYSWISRKTTTKSFSDIGRALGKPHEMIIYYVNEIEELISVDPRERGRVHGYLRDMPISFIKESFN
jgi:hypothetical protein